MCAIFTQMDTNFIWAADRIGSEGEQIKEILFSGRIAWKIPAIVYMVIEHYAENGKIDVKMNQDEILLGLDNYGDLVMPG